MTMYKGKRRNHRCKFAASLAEQSVNAEGARYKLSRDSCRILFAVMSFAWVSGC